MLIEMITKYSFMRYIAIEIRIIVKKIFEHIFLPTMKPITFERIHKFTQVKFSKMKKSIGFILIALFGVAILSSCSSQKQACAAYSKVEYRQPADNS